MHKLFLDANIFFAATASQTGGSFAIFELARLEKITIVTNEYAFKEARINIEKKLGKEQIPLFLQLASHLTAIDKTPLSSKIGKKYETLINSKDLPILTGAVKQKANFLITLDKKDFKTPALQKAHLAFAIMLPGEYLQSL